MQTAAIQMEIAPISEPTTNQNTNTSHTVLKVTSQSQTGIDNDSSEVEMVIFSTRFRMK